MAPTVTINKKLNLVIPIYHDDGKILYVHSAPIMRETFERYFLVLSKTFAQIFTKGLGSMVGPRVAALLLKQVATELGEWEGELGVERGLLPEFRRLTNVIAPSAAGWGPIPFDEARRNGLIDDEDADEVGNAICFFMLASAILRKTSLKQMLESAAEFWGASITSSNSTEFLNSLPTLDATESSGEKAIPSSIPS